MESTMPNANFQPQMVQYTPAESSMLKSVPPFVKPSSSNLAFVRTNRSANFELEEECAECADTGRLFAPPCPVPCGCGCGVQGAAQGGDPRSNDLVLGRVGRQQVECLAPGGQRGARVAGLRHALRGGG